MDRLRDTTPVLTIPVTLALIGWLLFGRGLFGFTVGGWMMLWLMILAVPVLVVCSTLSTVLMFRQPGRRLTTAQVWLQVICWIGLLIAGFAVVDGGDDPGEGMLAALLGGDQPARNLSELIFLTAMLTWLAAWVALTVLLIVGVARARADRLNAGRTAPPGRAARPPG